MRDRVNAATSCTKNTLDKKFLEEEKNSLLYFALLNEEILYSPGGQVELYKTINDHCKKKLL